jgi:hypothetical protein
MMARPHPSTSHDLRSESIETKRGAEDEWDVLASCLNDLGIIHVSPQRRRRTRRGLTIRAVFERLFGACDARLNQAAIFLLLTHPQLADAARAAIDTLEDDTLDRAKRRYVAASAMQRMARTRIAMQLGPQPELPPAYLNDLGLPSLELEHGKLVLIELARQEELRYGYDAWGTYRSLLDLFLAESRRVNWGRVSARGEALLCVSVPTVVA